MFSTRGTRSRWAAVSRPSSGSVGPRIQSGSYVTDQVTVDYGWRKDRLTLQVGKQITIEYFSESEAQGRPGVSSLRFPRIKAVWDGKRDL